MKTLKKKIKSITKVVLWITVWFYHEESKQISSDNHINNLQGYVAAAKVTVRTEQM